MAITVEPVSRIVFSPRSYQRDVRTARKSGKRFFTTVWHRRAGKDKFYMSMILEESQIRKGVYFHVFPSLNQGRRDIWDNIGSDGVKFTDIFPDEMVESRNELEMQVTFKNGSIYQVMGADDRKAIARLRGPNPVGLVYSEYGNMHIEAYTTLSPVLAENKGWAAFAYTPPDVLPICCVTGDPQTNRCRGNHAKLRYENSLNDPDYYCSLKTVDDTRRDGEGEAGGPVIDEEEMARERREHTEHYIMREYYCLFDTPVEGSYYGKRIQAAEIEGRISDDVVWDEKLPVHIAADLGAQKRTMAFGAFQLNGQWINWIDCWSQAGIGLPAYARAIRENNSYSFGRTFFPHDADAHEIGTGKTRKEVWKQLGFRDITVVQKLSPSDGIEVVYSLIPRMRFRRSTCGPLIHALKYYHEEAGHPKHDDTSHFADMVRYAMVGLKEPRQHGTFQPPQKQALTDHDPYARGPRHQRYANSGTTSEGRIW